MSNSPLITQFQSLHLVGIGGVGMSSLALILQAAGVKVSGCDREASRVTDYLNSHGIEVIIGHDPSHVDGVDGVIFTAAVPGHQTELEAAVRGGKMVMKRSVALGQLVNGLKTVAVSGTHGKTTTSSMVAAVLIEGELDPTVIVGSDIAQGVPGGRPGASDFVVVEADEAYASFLALEPEVAIITNIEPDHFEFYRSLDDLHDAFKSFMASARTVAINDQDEVAEELAPAGVRFFGTSSRAEVRGTDVSWEGGCASFDLYIREEPAGRVVLKVPGRHNLQNALAAAAGAHLIGVEPAVIVHGLSGFAGTARRLQQRGTFKEAIVIDDYAHHPTEIAVSLEAISHAHPAKRLVAVFQPHLFSRTRMFATEFGSALSRADVIVVCDIYPAREEPIEGVTSKLIVDAVGEHAPGKRVAYMPSLEDSSSFLDAIAGPADVIVVLGAGDITKLIDMLKVAS